jgi:hypothetical protein
MSEQVEKKRTGYKIVRLDSRGKIIDLTDPFPAPRLYNMDEDKYAPKYQINFREYDTETNKSIQSHWHRIDEDTLRLLSWDLMNGNTGEPTKNADLSTLLEEYKGSWDDEKEMYVSRRLQVCYNTGLRVGARYQFGFVATEGEKTATGAVEPKKGAEPFLKNAILIAPAMAREAGATLYFYLQAKLSASVLLHYSRVICHE